MCELLPEVRSWDGYGEVFTSVDVFEGAVREICGRHALSAREVSVGFPGSCPVFLVDQRHVVKLFPPMVETDQPREVFCYERLSGKDDLIPELLGCGTLEDRVSWPYLIVEYRKGVAIRDLFNRLGNSDRIQVAKRVAQLTSSIHSVTVDGEEEQFPDWSSFLSKHQEALASAHLEGSAEMHVEASSLSKQVCQEMPAYVQAYLDPSPKRTLIHGDLTEDHLLLEQVDEQFRPTALIDFADALIADVSYEWVALCLGMLNSDPEMIRAFFDAYNGERIDLAWRQKMFSWTLAHQFGPGIVKGFLEQQGKPKIERLEDLMEMMWPKAMEHA
jgi:hygromycin-B 7''-O-kinase